MIDPLPGPAVEIRIFSKRTTSFPVVKQSKQVKYVVVELLTRIGLKLFKRPVRRVAPIFNSAAQCWRISEPGGLQNADNDHSYAHRAACTSCLLRAVLSSIRHPDTSTETRNGNGMGDNENELTARWCARELLVRRRLSARHIRGNWCVPAITETFSARLSLS